MAKAGYSGSEINEVIWMGDVVNSACHLCGKAGRDGRKVIVVSDCIYGNLNEHNQGLLSVFYDNFTKLYEGILLIHLWMIGTKKIASRWKSINLATRTDFMKVISSAYP